MRARVTRIIGVVVVMSFVLQAEIAGPAAALPRGVFVDPKSPAGKEYSFPLSVLRGQGAGQPVPGEGGPAPRFGVGITPQGTAAPGGIGSGHPVSPNAAGLRSGERPSGHRRRTTIIDGSGGSGGSSGSSGQPAPQQSQATFGRLASPGSAVPAIALVAALVLVLGLALGAGFSRLSRRS